MDVQVSVDFAVICLKAHYCDYFLLIYNFALNKNNMLWRFNWGIQFNRFGFYR